MTIEEIRTWRTEFEDLIKSKIKELETKNEGQVTIDKIDFAHRVNISGYAYIEDVSSHIYICRDSKIYV